MKLKKWLFLLVVGWACSGVYAQELTVKEMKAVPMDLSASQYERKDLAGQPCGLVKVQLAAVGAQFEGNVIGKTEYKTGEYWVYMTEDSYMLQVKHSQFHPLMVNFHDFGIDKVMPLKTYKLTISVPQAEVNTGVLQVAYTPSGAEVYLDGMWLGKSPIVKRNVSVGAHKVVIKERGYYVTVRKDITMAAGKTVRLAGNLERPEEKDNMTASEMTALGIAYENGVGAPSDINQALAWLRKAAELGDTEAMLELGYLYKLGVKEKIKEDYVQAVEWFRKAADLGDPDGQRCLGDMYYVGAGGLPEDYVMAASLYLKAAQQNNCGAQFLLGKMYDQGKGVDKNPAEAMAWFRKASEQENGQAQYYLGMYYEKGIGVPVDKEQALFWYEKSSNNGNSDARRAAYMLNK